MAILAVWLVQPARAADIADGASLTIHVERISPGGGVLRLGLYDAASYPNDKSEPVAAIDVPAGQGAVTVTLKGLMPGRYAIQAFQDINANGKMDFGLLGLPKEPYGFSRDARPFLSKPGFDKAAFTLTAGENIQTLHLQNSHTIADAGF